jgi:hypothetical protein
LQTELFKTCSKCLCEYSIEHFHKRAVSKRYKDGRDGHCRACKAESHKRWSIRNKDKIAENARKFRKENVEKVKQWSHTYFNNNKEKISKRKRTAMLKKLYGLTLVEYEQMLEVQAGCCKICKNVFQTTPMTDHCHQTGIVRGLLCNKCNWLLGNANDNIDILHSAITYLSSFTNLNKEE